MDHELMPKQDVPSDPLATARWADPFYVADKYRYKSGAIWLGRNPHDPEQAIGYKDDRHVFICAETRSGKGRALLVNNQVLWPGSLITIGPKGEEATIAAPRRGQGNEYCEGLGQEVYVLDPMRCADVPDKYRAHFNPLSALDPEDGELVSKVDRIANAICTIPEGGESAEWAKEGKAYVANAILHVVTFKFISDDERDLLTVRDLVMQGNVEGAKLLRQHLIDQGRNDEAAQVDPYMILFKDMEKNPACHGTISRNARDMMQSARKHIKYFESVRKSASSHLRFLEGQGIMNTVARPREGALYPRTFDVQDLKSKSISLFICLPEQDYDPLARWLRAMVVIIMDAMREKQGLPANGHQILFCIDEFANLGKMDDVGKAINSIAGAGVKLMIAVQRLGDLQELYGKAWEKFIAGAGTQIWFGIEEVATGEYLEKKLGKTEIIKYARSIGKNSSDAIADGTSESLSQAQSRSASTSVGESRSVAESRSRSNTLSRTISRGISKNSGSSKGSSAGRNYGPHLFFEGFMPGTNYSDQTGQSRGRAWNRQKTFGRSNTITHGRTETVGGTTSNTEQTGSSETRQTGSSHTQTHTDGQNAGMAETFHVKPLLSVIEAKQFLISLSEHEHAAHPGLALVTLAEEENPFFVRKTNYDQDPVFTRRFNPNPAYPYIPLEEQPLLGWQITPEHFYTVEIPESLNGVPLEITLEPGISEKQYLEKSETLLCLKNPESSLPKVRYKAPFKLKIIEILDPVNSETKGLILSFRSDDNISESKRQRLDEYFWKQWIDDHEKRRYKEEQARQAHTRKIASLKSEITAIEKEIKSAEQRLREARERLDQQHQLSNWFVKQLDDKSLFIKIGSVVLLFAALIISARIGKALDSDLAGFISFALVIVGFGYLFVKWISYMEDKYNDKLSGISAELREKEIKQRDLESALRDAEYEYEQSQ